jgi:hypothetical protein
VTRIYKICLALLLTGLLGACDPGRDIETQPAVDLGNFRLGHNVAVVVEDVQRFPASREVTADEWVTSLTTAMEARFGRYQGNKFYHLALSVRAYNLAPIQLPGIPTPPSGVNLHARIWDDRLGEQLTRQPKVLQIVDVVKASGINAKKDRQLEFLSELAAKEVEKWLLENPQWFVDDGSAATGALVTLTPEATLEEAAKEP